MFFSLLRIVSVIGFMMTGYLQAEVTRPTAPDGYTCGENFGPALYDADGTQVEQYHLNATADELKEKGIEVKVLQMLEDQILQLSYTDENGETVERSLTSKSRRKRSIDQEQLVPVEEVVMQSVNKKDVEIVGGRDAAKEHSYGMAHLGTRTESGQIGFFCGGTIINELWVLSAAHCAFSGYDLNLIRLGDYNLNGESGSESVPYVDSKLDFGVEKVVFYPNFVEGQSLDDILLVKLNHPIPKYSRRIHPMCLPWYDSKDEKSLEDLVGTEATITGWGTRKWNESDFGNLLQIAEVEIFDVSHCKNYHKYKKDFPNGILQEDFICAGTREGGKDACQGDSGGPLWISGPKNSQKTLLGVVSAGSGCANKKFPGLYVPTMSAKYLNWIKENAFS